MALAQAGKIKHALKRVRFEDINENLEMLRDGDIVGRAVVTFSAAAHNSPRKAVSQNVGAA
jgi:D-arabinose 1-dehydrogenase-like Zn-dependent alcohol dehydrogenase